MGTFTWVNDPNTCFHLWSALWSDTAHSDFTDKVSDGPNKVSDQSGSETVKPQCRGMERMALLCPRLPTAVFPRLTLFDLFTHSDLSTTTTKRIELQVCLFFYICKFIFFSFSLKMFFTQWYSWGWWIPVVLFQIAVLERNFTLHYLFHSLSPVTIIAQLY